MPVKTEAAALLAARRLIEQSNKALDDAVVLTVTAEEVGGQRWHGINIPEHRVQGQLHTPSCSMSSSYPKLNPKLYDSARLPGGTVDVGPDDLYRSILEQRRGACCRQGSFGDSGPTARLIGISDPFIVSQSRSQKGLKLVLDLQVMHSPGLPLYFIESNIYEYLEYLPGLKSYSDWSTRDWHVLQFGRSRL